MLSGTDRAGHAILFGVSDTDIAASSTVAASRKDAGIGSREGRAEGDECSREQVRVVDGASTHHGTAERGDTDVDGPGGDRGRAGVELGQDGRRTGDAPVAAGMCSASER